MSLRHLPRLEVLDASEFKESRFDPPAEMGVKHLLLPAA
jgi:hypothetical protein